MDLREAFVRTRQFILDDQWVSELTGLSRARRFFITWSRILTLSAREFVKDHCTLRAATLTLVVIFSLAPTLAVAFAVAKGFGQESRIQPLMYKLVGVSPDQIAGNPALEKMQALLDSMLKYIGETNVQALGFVGFLVMLYAAYTVLSSVEKTFNVIWAVRARRTPLRQAIDYLAVLFVLPLMLILSVLLSAGVESTLAVGLLQQWVPAVVIRWAGHLATFGFTAFGLWFLYFFFPNTRIQFRAALVGAVVAALLWAVLQVLFIKLQMGVARYNKIYSTFAAVPIFLLWLQFSWTVILFGAEVSYSYAHQSDYQFGGLAFRAGPAHREQIALGVSALAAEAFIQEKDPPCCDDLSRQAHAPVTVVREVLADLVAGRVLTEVQGSQPCYVPAAPPDQITLARVVDAVSHRDVEQPHMSKAMERLGVRRVLQQRDEQSAAFRNMTLKELVGENTQQG